MAERHKIGPDGILSDGVRIDPADASDIAGYRRARASVGAMRVPRIFDQHNRHARLFVADFDGTGNDAINDPEHKTNVARLHDQLADISQRDPRIVSDYHAGPGTQRHVLERAADSALGFTYHAKIIEMYQEFVKQAIDWARVDPGAQISVMGIGFSRGSEHALGFARLVDSLGIQELSDRELKRVLDGDAPIISRVVPLRVPGHVMQALVLFDPVGTGVPYLHNRSIPSSVASVLQFTGRHEARDLFPVTQVVPPGLSADGRYLNVLVAGAHSTVGGGYHHYGLTALNHNLAVDYINGLFGEPLLQKVALPTDPWMYAVSHSEEHMAFYSTSYMQRNGMRDVMSPDATGGHCYEAVSKCSAPGPVNAYVAAYPLYPVSIGPLPPGLSLQEADMTERHVELPSHRSAAVPGGADVYRASDNAARGLGPFFEGAENSRLPSGPQDAGHRNHVLYESISIQLAELHARENIPVDKEDLDRLSTALLVECREAGITQVNHVQFGEDEHGRRTTQLLAYDAPNGDLDHPFARFGGIDGAKAIDTPVDVSIRQLETANRSIDQSMDQIRSLREREMEQQTQGRSV